MGTGNRLQYLDNLRTFLIFLVVLVHAGVVYESSGVMAPYWVVDDPATSDLTGLVNLILDLFVMPTIFFISGYLAPVSRERRGTRHYLAAKARRLLVPWILALFTLIPLYNMLFLVSRGLPQRDWTHYFHFTNGVISMSWLWFLPVLFLFHALYAALGAARLRWPGLTPGRAVAAVFLLSVVWGVILGELGWLGWTKTALIDFQNERLLPNLLIFLLGAFCGRRGILETNQRNMKLYVAASATAWIPINVYLVVFLNFFLRPGHPIFSARIDGLVFWFSLHLSALAVLYCLVMSFRYYCQKQGRLGRTLGRLSYPVYIVHIAVMSPIAIALLGVDLPGLVKYPILALATYVASNLVALAYVRGRLLLRNTPVQTQDARTVGASSGPFAVARPVSSLRTDPRSASPAGAGTRLAGPPRG